MPRENITLLDEIGQGEFGVVMSASAVQLPNTDGRYIFHIERIQSHCEYSQVACAASL